jgi:hypothetical protein
MAPTSDVFPLVGVGNVSRKHAQDIRPNWADISIPEMCPVFGTKLAYVEGRRTHSTPSLDRIDSSKGYIPGNVIVVSWRANDVKRTSTPEELIAVGVFYQNLVEKRDKDALVRITRLADFRSD